VALVTAAARAMVFGARPDQFEVEAGSNTVTDLFFVVKNRIKLF